MKQLQCSFSVFLALIASISWYSAGAGQENELAAERLCPTSSGVPLLEDVTLTPEAYQGDQAGSEQKCDEKSECPPCPESTGVPIASRGIECAFVKVIPYGFIRWEAYWDTRQNIGNREEQRLDYPDRYLPDIFGVDINAHGKWQMTPIETRIGLLLIGPQWRCFRTEGVIEGDFRGPSDASILGFRLRHAYGKILWEGGSFIFGQWWHPLFIPECFPNTVSYNIGSPMEPQARDPQLRLTQRWDWFELAVAAASQRDFQSFGPIGMASDYIRDAVTPNLTVVTKGYFNDDNSMVGFAADYLRLVPRIVSNNVAVCEHINSFIVEAFSSLIHAPWSLRMKVFWAQNGNDQLLLSGFGVRTVNSFTDERTYSNTAATGAWLDFSYIFCCDSMELGLFVGGTKNLGSRHALFIDPTTHLPIIYAFNGDAQNIDYVVRVSPRYIFKRDPIRFGAELEWTRASWGTPNRFGKVCNGCPVDNFRILMALYYVF